MFEKLKLRRAILKTYDKAIDQSKLYLEYKNKKNWQYREIIQKKPDGINNFIKSVDDQLTILYKAHNLITNTGNIAFLSNELNLLTTKLNGLIITLKAQKKTAESEDITKLETLMREEQKKMVLINRYLFFVNMGLEKEYKRAQIKEETPIFFLRWTVFLILGMMLSSKTDFREWENLRNLIIATGLYNAALSAIYLTIKKM